MDAKMSWPVVKFLIHGTGLRRREARQLLQEIPENKYSELFIRALAWDREIAASASKMLDDLLSGANVMTFKEATKRARTPSTSGREDYEEAEERAAPRRKRARK